MFFFGGGKCPNLGVGNVRISGVVNVLLANDSQSFFSETCISSLFESLYPITGGDSLGAGIRGRIVPSLPKGH